MTTLVGVQHRRGTTAQNDQYLGLEGEITIDSERYTLRIHDGVRLGGQPVKTEIKQYDIGVGLTLEGNLLRVTNPFDPSILTQKQNILVSGENIKTLNGMSLLGEGNIAISSIIGELGGFDPYGEYTHLRAKGTTKEDIGLERVDNTNDLEKPLSVAMQMALAQKQDKLESGLDIKTLNGQSLIGEGDLKIELTLENYFETDGDYRHLRARGTTKEDVGLDHVDNTGDLYKPISNAVQAALDYKQDTLVSGRNIKTLNGRSIVGEGNLDLIIDFSKEDINLGQVKNIDTTDASNITYGVLPEHVIPESVVRTSQSIEIGPGLKGVGHLTANPYIELAPPQTLTGQTANHANAGGHTHKLTLTKADVGLAHVPDVDCTDASNITKGTISDDLLSANIPRLDVFLMEQSFEFDSPTLKGYVHVDGELMVNGPYKTKVERLHDQRVICSLGNYFKETLSVDTAITFDDVPKGGVYSFILELYLQEPVTVIWPHNVRWPDHFAPYLEPYNVHLFAFITDDEGVRWRAASVLNYHY